MLKMRQHELAGGAVDQLYGGTRLRIDQLGVDKAACAQVHAVLRFALTPKRHADIADAHRLGDPRAPALLELRAKGWFATAGLACHEYPLDARACEIELALCRPFD